MNLHDIKSKTEAAFLEIFHEKNNKSRPGFPYRDYGSVSAAKHVDTDMREELKSQHHD